MFVIREEQSSTLRAACLLRTRVIVPSRYCQEALRPSVLGCWVFLFTCSPDVIFFVFACVFVCLFGFRLDAPCNGKNALAFSPCVSRLYGMYSGLLDLPVTLISLTPAAPAPFRRSSVCAVSAPNDQG